MVHMASVLASLMLTSPAKLSIWRFCLDENIPYFLGRLFNEIWHAGRGRWLVHDGMQYDPIQGQGHEPFKLEIRPFSKAISSIYDGSWQLTTETRAQYLHLIWPYFWYLSKFLCRVTLNLAETSVVKSRPSVTYGANFYVLTFILCMHLQTQQHTTNAVIIIVIIIF